MSSIQDAILAKLQSELTQKLITDIDDTSKAGVIKIGELQGEPDPDVARISVTLFVNDPDQEIKNSGIGNSPEAWDDTIYETEIGGGIMWKRRFTVKCRCLFTNTKEDAATSRSIATTLKQRIEQTILGTNFGGISAMEPGFQWALLAMRYEAKWCFLAAPRTASTITSRPGFRF